MNYWIQKSFFCALGIGLAITSTGCMTSPGHGEFVGSPSDSVSFNGYLLDPNQWVRIEAKHPTQGWKTIGWAKSKSYSYHYDGSDWHPWNKSLQVPAEYWKYIGYGYVAAEVRAVQYSTGTILPTFEAGFSSWFDPSQTLGEMWNEHGHESSVMIFAQN